MLFLFIGRSTMIKLVNLRWRSSYSSSNEPCSPPSACCPLESLTLPVSLHAAFIEYQGVPLCSVTGSCQLLEADWETWRKRGPERDRLPGRKVFWQSFFLYYFVENLCRVDVAANCCIGFLTLTSWTHWRYLSLFTSASLLTERLLPGFILRL